MEALTHGLRRHHRRRHHHHGQGSVRVRQRFAWWQLWFAAFGILVTAAAILAMEPWRRPLGP